MPTLGTAIKGSDRSAPILSEPIYNNEETISGVHLRCVGIGVVDELEWRPWKVEKVLDDVRIGGGLKLDATNPNTVIFNVIWHNTPGYVISPQDLPCICSWRKC